MTNDTFQTTNGPVRERWGRVWFGYRANAVMLWVGRRALWAGYVGVWMAALWFFLFSGKARRASSAYLERVRGRRWWLRRWWETYCHMLVYGYLLMDRAVMLAGEGHGFAVEREGVEHMYAAAGGGGRRGGEGGVIVLSAHFGNAEAAMPYLAAKMGSVLRERKISVVMWQDLGEGTERFHAEKRALMRGMDVISTTDPVRAGVRIIGALRAGGVVGMRADRRMGGKTVAVEFLGGKVELPAGPFVAAALTGAPVVSVYTCRSGYRKYVCVIGAGGGVGRYGEGTGGTEANGGTREERIERAARDFVHGLEAVVKRWPLQWGNFYDVWADGAGAPSPDAVGPGV